MNKKFSLFIIVCAVSSIAFSQLSVPGKPESFSLQLKKTQLLPIKTLNIIDSALLLAEDRKTGIPNRYGVVQDLDVDIKKDGVCSEIPGKGNIWQYELKSLSAFSLGIFFKKFYIPEGASVFIYDETHSRLAGAFTSINNWETKQLPISEFPGNHVIIEYFEPLHAEFSGELVIGKAVQSYRNLFQIGLAGRIGINCPSGANWQNVKHSVCLMTFYDSQFSYTCTGFLVNNVREDGTPYFQTASHCLSSNSLAATLVVYFNYENSTCSSNDAAFISGMSLSGATVKAFNDYSDFSLLLLNQYPTQFQNPYWAGWDASNSGPLSGAGIHHPAGAPKCISLDPNPPSSFPSIINWQENSTFTNTTQPNTHWEVNFTTGGIESGSSGSPLFNEKQQVIGQLHGGTATDDFYGKMSLSWNYSSLSSEQLKYWLDPDNTGAIRMNGSYLHFKPVTNFSTKFTNVCSNVVIKLVDQTKFLPNSWNWVINPPTVQYAYGTTSASRNPQLSFTNNGNYSITLTTSNDLGTDSISKINFITAGKLNISFSGLPLDGVVCGSNIGTYTLIPAGADAFSFSFSGTDTSLSYTNMTSLPLYLVPAKKINHSFDIWTILKGTQGTCVAYDSVMLHVSMPSNDNFENAARLYPGRNIAFSNFCSSVQLNEPNPPTTACYSTNSWCPMPAASDTVLSHTIWFSFIGPPNGLVTIDTHGFADKIAVYQADVPRNIMSGYAPYYKIVAANDGRSVSDKTAFLANVSVEPYKTYFLQLDGHNKNTGTTTIDLITESIEVYPNPSNGIFTVSILGKEEGIANVKIISMIGNVVYSDKFPVSLDSNKFSFDLSTLTQGVYFIHSTIDGISTTAKLMLVK